MSVEKPTRSLWLDESTRRWCHRWLAQTICLVAVAVALLLNLFGIQVSVFHTFVATFTALFNIWLLGSAAFLLYRTFVSLPRYKRDHPNGTWTRLWPLVPALFLIAGLGLLVSAVYLAPTTWQQLRTCLPG